MGNNITLQRYSRFLEYLYDKKLQNKYEILIIGKATSNDIFNILLKYANQNIVIKNECPDHCSLQSIISQSRLVVFTYAKSSVLSSGALMDTLGFGANIIGPNVGAFADLEKEGLLRTFNDFTNLIVILDEELHKVSEICNDKVTHFLGDNSWFKYAEKIDIFTDI